MTDTLVEIRKLSKHFKLGRGRFLHAVDEVDLDIRRGEILGLVGESGCGKSTLGRLVIRLHEETSGTIRYNGREITGKMSLKDRRQFCRDVQLIFQDPYSALNPRMIVRDIIAEGPDATGLWPRSERKTKVDDWLRRVGLDPAHANRYPHEFSGGQRQRIGIARALAMEPKLVICDEPISALDVSVQAQIINLLQDLQKQRELTYLFIAHDLSMMRAICDRLVVMYLGRVVELGTSSQVYDDPQHPYSQALVNANPIPDPKAERAREHHLIKGEVGSPVNPKPGCRFANRCPHVFDRCRYETPPLVPTRQDGTVAACHLYTH